VRQAVENLSAKAGGERVFGSACDVRDLPQVQALWDAAQARFGRIDIWINNAGQAHPITSFQDFSANTIQSVLQTNIAGTMHGAMVALRGFQKQNGGAIYNMMGLGSNGRQVARMALYGASKSAVAYLHQALVRETRGGPVLVGALMPGMVTTELLTQQREYDPQEWEKAKRIFNILADRVETVTPWLAQRVLENQKHGAMISWINPLKIGWRFLSAPFTHRRVIED
jgi:NAD(P)-dependent dehydrogenase (short-subunit alcohol dehydrogenase family)